MNSSIETTRISERNQELRAMLTEAREYRMQGRVLRAAQLEVEAVKYRGQTLKLAERLGLTGVFA